jgi:hypothetical protein
MNIDDILAQQNKLLDKAKTGVATKTVAQADLAQPVDPAAIKIQTVFQNVSATGSKAALAQRYQAAIAQRQPAIAQVKQGISSDQALKAAMTSKPAEATKNVMAVLNKSAIFAAAAAAAKTPPKVEKLAPAPKKNPKAT